MSYKAILFNTALRTLQPETYNIIQNETQMIIKKCFEMKINTGKTEPSTVTVPHFKVKTVCNGHLPCQIDGEGVNYKYDFLNFKCSKVFVQVDFVACGNLTQA